MNALISLVLVIVSLLSDLSCSATTAGEARSKMGLVGSTPAGAEIRSLLGLDQAAPIDFIRWDLSLDQNGNTFGLNINFGEGQPNTRGLKGGGEKRFLDGRYGLSKSKKGDMLNLTTDKAASISLLKLNENVFHLLTAEGKLMTGNGGWSYTLSRKEPVESESPLTSMTTALVDERFRETVFVGRTPCVDLRRDDLEVGPACLKLKWKLTLYRDPATNRPARYRLESTANRLKPVEGTWTLVNGTHTNPRALMIELDRDRPRETISFLVGDENVLFLLDKRLRILAGNEDFGYTLNRDMGKKPE